MKRATAFLFEIVSRLKPNSLNNTPDAQAEECFDIYQANLLKQHNRAGIPTRLRRHSQHKTRHAILPLVAPLDYVSNSSYNFQEM